jgi:uncharacterized membrane protein YfcA
MEAGLALGLPAAVAGGAIIALLLGLFGGGGSVLATPLLLLTLIHDQCSCHMKIPTAAEQLWGW